MTLNWLLDLYRYPRNAARDASVVIVAFVIFNKIWIEVFSNG